ncbi:hypothetical protein [Nocardia brasiliensis]|uniref:hypothetical protein n=1 Tax=Nocardia brasiliensis TaxID=37326 RepID=UPI002456C57E|nr:hypothetical protein [Nocardia brasiliensis]
MSTPITATSLVCKVRELAAASPDTITPTTHRHPHGNRYVVRDSDGRWKGSRLLGRALLELGADPDSLAEHDAHGHSAATTLLHFVRLGVRGQEMLWLNLVQNQEAKGYPWQRAITCADLRIKGVIGSSR